MAPRCPWHSPSTRAPWATISPRWRGCCIASRARAWPAARSTWPPPNGPSRPCCSALPDLSGCIYLLCASAPCRCQRWCITTSRGRRGITPRHIDLEGRTRAVRQALLIVVHQGVSIPGRSAELADHVLDLRAHAGAPEVAHDVAGLGIGPPARSVALTQGGHHLGVAEPGAQVVGGIKARVAVVLPERGRVGEAGVAAQALGVERRSIATRGEIGVLVEVLRAVAAQ